MILCVACSQMGRVPPTPPPHLCVCSAGTSQVSGWRRLLFFRLCILMSFFVFVSFGDRVASLQSIVPMSVFFLNTGEVFRFLSLIHCYEVIGGDCVGVGVSRLF